MFYKRKKGDKNKYRERLRATLRCLRYLLHQGLAIRGHDETEESSNRGNFLELLKWLARLCKDINKVVLKNAPKNHKLTSHMILKELKTPMQKKQQRKLSKTLVKTTLQSW